MYMKKILGRIMIVIPAIALQVLWYCLMFGLLNNLFRGYLWNAINALLSILAFVFVTGLVAKRDESSYKLLWVMVIVAMPVFGAMLYLMLGNKNTGKKPLFVFIAIEKEPPYAINIMQADELLHRRGYDIFRELIGIYHDCKQTGNWYGYLGKYNQINNLALPAWLAKEVE